MVTFLITSLFILGFLVLAVYFWQRPAPHDDVERLPPLRRHRALFAEVEPAPAQSQVDIEEQQTDILARARDGELQALDEAAALNKPKLYNEVLDSLLLNANESKVLAIASHVSRNELTVTPQLAKRFRQLWEASPDRQSTAKMLHLSARADDAAAFTAAVEAVLDSWRKQTLNDVSAEELNSLINSEYWLLSSAERSSGAGFVLKQTIAKAKNELT